MELVVTPVCLTLHTTSTQSLLLSVSATVGIVVICRRSGLAHVIHCMQIWTDICLSLYHTIYKARTMSICACRFDTMGVQGQDFKADLLGPNSKPSKGLRKANLSPRTKALLEEVALSEQVYISLHLLLKYPKPFN